jgi:hypothetical protein
MATEMVLKTVFSHVRSGVFDSCVLFNSESHRMFNTLRVYSVFSSSLFVFCAHGFDPGAQYNTFFIYFSLIHILFFVCFIILTSCVFFFLLKQKTFF